MFNTDERYEMEIVDLSTQGEGIGKVEGLAIFVPGAIPGETVKVRIAEHKKSIARGIVEKIITPSPYRIKPFCKYEGNCGGCGLQSIRYDGQLIIKKKWVKDRLSRIGGIENPIVHDVIPMEDPVIYRNKAQYVVARVTGEEKKLRACTVGFHRARTHEAIDIDHCPIQTEAANRIAEVVRNYVKEFKVPVYDSKTGTGLLRHLIVKTAYGTGDVMVILVATARRIPGAEWLAGKISEALEDMEGYSFESMILNVNRTKRGEIMGTECITLGGNPTIIDEMMGKQFEISALSFYQVNPTQTEKLYQKVIEYADLNGTETVLDLYCGVGTIGLFLADKAKRVIGIESQKKAVMDANRNAVLNGCVNAEFIHGKAEEELPKLTGQGIQPDLIVLDPPRSGCDLALLAAVAEAGPPKIIYVSCDPATLARDLKYLRGHGYEMVEAQPVDLFPHAGNVEVVALLTKSQSD